MTTTIDFAEMTDDQLVELVAVHADNEDAVAAILSELDRRTEAPTPADVDAEEEAATAYRALVQDARRPGERLGYACDRLFRDWAYEQYIAAENATNGYLLNKAGQAAKVDPHELFVGRTELAAKYASEELRDWWAEHPRMTRLEYRALMLGRSTDVQRAKAARDHARNLGLGY